MKDREGMVAKAGTGNTAFYRNYMRGGGAVIYYITIVVREIYVYINMRLSLRSLQALKYYK